MITIMENPFKIIEIKTIDFANESIDNTSEAEAFMICQSSM